MTEPTDVRNAARAFLVAAFGRLREDAVIPTPVFHPVVRTGRDFYGHRIDDLASYASFEDRLMTAYPTVFSAHRDDAYAEFPSTFVFSLLEATVARCGRVREFDPTGPPVEESIDEMLSLLEGAPQRVLCCRVVSNLTSDGGERVRLGDVCVVPQQAAKSLERIIADEIPAAADELNRRRPYGFGSPLSLVIAEGTTTAADVFTFSEELSRRVDRFLRDVRLLTGGTIRSAHEVLGTTTLVTRMPPQLVSFPLGGQLRRVWRSAYVSKSDATAHAGLRTLIESIEVRRQGVLATSIGVAVSKFNSTFHRGETPFEHIVELATALEAALGGGESDNAGLTLRLRSRAAALLATRDDPADKIFGDIGLIYAIRSTLVHGGEIKTKDLRKATNGISTIPRELPADMFGITLSHVADRMRDLVRRAILARLCLAAGANPPWPFHIAVPVDARLSDDTTRAAWRAYWRQRLADLEAPHAAERQILATDLMSDARQRSQER